MNNPLVSILMTAYNAERYIGDTINSVLNQTYEHFEFLIIDDCSSDSTADIISSFKDPRIVLIKKEGNEGFKGYVKNLNQLIETSKGKYIARIDADDIWHSNKLKTQIGFLEKHPHIGLIGSSIANQIDNEGAIQGTINLLPLGNKVEEYILRRNPIIHPSIVFRRNIDTTYRWKLFYCEDYDFHLQNLSKGIQYHITDEILMDYRVLASSLSHNNKVLIRALFVNQAKTFYEERTQQGGTDNYENFEPDSILNILDSSHSTPYSLLKTALRFSFIAGLKEDFLTIFSKIKKQYGVESIPLLYRIIKIKFNFFYKLYQLK